MQILRGTTPTITANVRSNIDLSNITHIWVYIYQQGNIVIDKEVIGSEVEIDDTDKTIKVTLSQEDTLSLKADIGALFQIRLLLSNDTALATPAVNVIIREVYKGGIIGGSTNE